MKSHRRSGLFVCARIAAIAAAFAALAPAFADAAIAVTMTWSPNPDPATAGYYVYLGLDTHNYTTIINAGNTTSVVVYLPDPRDPSTKYYFAVQAYTATGGQSPLSAETVFAASDAPTLRNPGSMSSVMGVSITAVQLIATDPRGQTLTYSAGGLPPGLSISSNSGRISGTPTTAGNYFVTAAATNTVGVSMTQLFTWTIVGPTTGTPPPSSGGTPGGGSIGTPPPSSGGIPGGGSGSIGTPPPSSGGIPGGGSGSIGTPPPSSGGNPGGGIGTPPPSSGGNPGGGTPPGSGGFPPTGPDQTPPAIRVSSPTSDGTRTMNTKIIVTGTASDNVGVAIVMWANNRGGVGTSLGTTTWATTPIDLKMGDNIITITASDAAGNVQTLTFTVTRIVDYENHVN